MKNIIAVFFKLGTRHVQQKRNQIVLTLLAEVSFCQIPNILIFNPLKYVLLATDMVSTFI